MPPKISQAKLKQLPTEKIEFMLGVGKAGLSMWNNRSRAFADVQAYMAVLETELAVRKRSTK